MSKAKAAREQFLSSLDTFSGIPQMFLTAEGMACGAPEHEALAEASRCLQRHGFEEPGIESAAQMLREMRTWAEERKP